MVIIWISCTLHVFQNTNSHTTTSIQWTRLHSTYKWTSMAHINELPWHKTNFHDTFGVIPRHTLKHLYNHMLTSTYNTTLYYKIKHSRGEARWSLSRPTTVQSQTHWSVPSGTIKRRLQYYAKISRLYMTQYIECTKACRLQALSAVCRKGVSSAKHNVHTNIHTTHNIHSQRTLWHIQAFTHDTRIQEVASNSLYEYTNNLGKFVWV